MSNEKYKIEGDRETTELVQKSLQSHWDDLFKSMASLKSFFGFTTSAGWKDVNFMSVGEQYNNICGTSKSIRVEFFPFLGQRINVTLIDENNSLPPLDHIEFNYLSNLENRLINFLARHGMADENDYYLHCQNVSLQKAKATVREIISFANTKYIPMGLVEIETDKSSVTKFKLQSITWGIFIECAVNHLNLEKFTLNYNRYNKSMKITDVCSQKIIEVIESLEHVHRI